MLENKTVVITGGASGIGLAVAQAMATAGARVAIGGRRPDAIETALKSISGKNPAIGRSLDVADRQNVDAFFAWVQNMLGQVDILVQAAGVNIRNRSMEAMKPEEWDEVIAINATGAYNCFHAVLPGMRSRKDGLIFNISSVAGKRAIALGGVAYSASKFAMTALGTCVANEASVDGVRVTNVYPGEVNTPILDKRPVPVTEEHRQRILQPSDVADMIMAIAQLPAHAHVPEIVIKPVSQNWN
jgi:NADP-dependent 3-hydroxy acid dehydrogenase YdfG